MLEPRRMLTFREVARQRSFSEAARALALSQPAVSQQVAALEQELGVRLLERDAGGVTLTASGRLLLDHANAVFERIELARAQLGESARTQARTLRIGAPPSAIATVIPRALGRLMSDHPDLEAGIVEASIEELAEGVSDGSLHAAVCFQDASRERAEPRGTARRDLVHEPFVALLPPGHRLARRRRIKLTDLAEEPWTAPSREGLLWRTCVTAGFEPRISFLTNDPLAIRALVAQGLAVTLTPPSLARELAGVSAVPLVGEPARRTVYALLPAAGAKRIAEDFVEAVASASRAGASH